MRPVLFVVFAAVLLGTFAALLPGMHPNSIGAILMQIAPDWEYIRIVLIGMLGVYTVLAYFPSIFFGVPEGDTQISLLPAQRLLSGGRGMEALVVCATAAVLAGVASALLIPITMPYIPYVFEVASGLVVPILVVASIILICKEKGLKKRACAACVFLLSGILAWIVFSLHLKDPLFALFAGFFAMPQLLRSGETALGAKQDEEKNDYSLSYLPYVGAGVLMGAIADFIPGISTPAQIAVFSSVFIKMDDARNFLAHVAAIEASHNVFALASAASVGVARVGTVAIMQETSPIVAGELPAFIAMFLLCLGIGAFLLITLGKYALGKMGAIDVKALSRAIAAYLLIMVFLLNGIEGVVALASATAIGMLAFIWKIGRTHVMGSLILNSLARAI